MKQKILIAFLLACSYMTFGQATQPYTLVNNYGMEWYRGKFKIALHMPRGRFSDSLKVGFAQSGAIMFDSNLNKIYLSLDGYRFTRALLDSNTAAIYGAANYWGVAGNVLSGTGTIGPTSNHGINIIANNITRIGITNAGVMTLGPAATPITIDASGNTTVNSGRTFSAIGGATFGVVNATSVVNSTSSNNAAINLATTGLTFRDNKANADVLGNFQHTNVSATGPVLQAFNQAGTAGLSVISTGQTDITAPFTVNTTAAASAATFTTGGTTRFPITCINSAVTSATSLPLGTYLAPTLGIAATSNVYLTLGIANTANNAGSIQFNYNTVGGTGNYISLGLNDAANDRVLKAYGTNEVTINQASPVGGSVKLTVGGTAKFQGLVPNSVTITASTYTTLGTDYTVFGNTASNSINITLSNFIANQQMTFYKTNLTNTLTLTPSSGTINGLSSLPTTALGSGWTVTFDGTNYWAK